MEITSDYGQKFYSWMQTKVQWHNEAGHAGYGQPNCPQCRGKGYVMKLRGTGINASLCCDDCECVTAIRSQQVVRLSGMENLMARCRFDNFKAEFPWQKQMLSKVSENLESENWLYLAGQSGCGKTHLAVALCGQLAKKSQVVYMSWPAEVKRLLALAYDFAGRQQLMDRFKDARVLLIDDLFKTRTNADGLPELSRQEGDLAFEIIDHRYRNELRTVITGELHMDALGKLNQALAGRIAHMAGKFVSNVGYGEERNMRGKGA